MAKKDDHWFKFYYRLILISCQGWRDDEFGAYVRLLIHQFDKDGLPGSEAEISKLITTFKKNWPLLQTKFKKGEDGLLRNDFMKEIREERNKKSATASDNGKIGGRGNKKAEGLENKAKAFKNESNVLSPSISPSTSQDEEVSLKGEEGWNTFPTEKEIELWLPDITIGAVTQLFKISKGVDASGDDIGGLWEIFKAQNFTGKKFYQSQSSVYSHFVNWCKTQTINGTHQQSANKTHPKPATRKSAGAHELADQLREDIASHGRG